ncbi:MAG TPA: MBOAT family O-acyltransferase [Bacillota bacterium]|nr:MBOAT family O-acyltransferase [Bacillota bacterium]
MCVGIYLAVKKTRNRNFVLIIFSLLFYAFGEPLMVLLLVASAFVNFLLAKAIAANRGNGYAKAALAAALIYDIGMLGIFKYTDFVIDNINALSGLSIEHAGIALPLGISFYTFQIISYVIDVYWEKVDAQKHFSKLLLYISLFPQLVAGPIVRYSTIEEEIDNRTVSISDLSAGATRLIIGLSKKVLIANSLNLLVQECFTDKLSGATVVGTWVGVIAYSMYVYFDFSGYSDMAIGMGRMFGFHFDENFRYPFMCRSITEFWQRWHISLGSFFRDYLLYVPLFGKRRQVLSLFLVWFTTGLWHGASWNYVLWGLYFGVFLFIETKIGKKRLKNAPSVLMHFYNKLVIIVGFGIFRFENMKELGVFFKNLIAAGGNAFITTETCDTILKYLTVIAVAVIACFPVVPYIKKRVENLSSRAQGTLVLASTAYTLALMFINTAVLVATSSSNNPFLYWRF